MLLVDQQIKKHIKWGSIVIDPFIPEHLNNASYDLTLGPFFARYVAEEPAGVSIIPLAASCPTYVIEDARKEGFIVLEPGERILGHTNEFAGGKLSYSPPRMTNVAVNTHLQATSTAARIGLTACMCAGWGDVGFINRWTLEIQNMSPNRVQLPVGAILAQIVFYEVEGPEKLYHREVYQPQDDLEKLKATWRPEMMLPKRLKVHDGWKKAFPI